MAKGGMEKPRRGGGDSNPRYADRGGWKTCPAVPEQRVQIPFEERRRP